MMYTSDLLAYPFQKNERPVTRTGAFYEHETGNPKAR